ncbi:unnamed protein product [Closterium sp. NIES-53]
MSTCRRDSLSPQQLCKWAVRWGSLGGGAGGTCSGGAVPTRAGGSGGANTQPHQSALCRLLTLPPAATEFLVAGSTPPLLFPPSRKEPASRPVKPVCSHHAVRPLPPHVPGTHIMALRPSSIPQRVVLPSPPASSLPHVPDLELDLVRLRHPSIRHRHRL